MSKENLDWHQVYIALYGIGLKKRKKILTGTKSTSQIYITEALNIALYGIGLEKGDVVITSAADR